MQEEEGKLIRIIRSTEKKLGEFLNKFYENIKNLANFDQHKVVKDTLSDFMDFLGRDDCMYRFAGIFLWDDICKKHILLGDFFSSKLNKKNYYKVKNWIFSGEENKEIALLVTFILRKWRNKEKVIHITTEKSRNNNDYIDLISLITQDMCRRGEIPSFVDQYIDYTSFFNKPEIEEFVSKYSVIFKKLLANKDRVIIDGTQKQEEIAEMSTMLAKNITLLYAYDKKWKHIYIMPALIYRPKINVEVKGDYPTGGLFIGTTEEIPEETLFLFKNFITTISSHIALIFQNREVASHSLRSAVAAIIARNMSHTLCSQILMRCKNIKEMDISLNKINEAKNALENLIKNRKNNLSFSTELSNVLNKLEADSIKKAKEQLNKVLDYITARSEFVANVTSKLPIIYGKNFLRIYNQGNEGGIIIDFNNSLIKEKLAEAGDIQKLSIEVDGKLTDIQVGLPFGPEVGAHAIYSILENYIRNISRHGNSTEELKVTLEKGDEDCEDSIWIKLTSNSTIVDDDIFLSEDHEKIYKRCPGLKGKRYDSINSMKKNCLSGKIEKIKKALEEPIIDTLSGEVSPSGWGLKEMKICAALLGGYNLESLLLTDFYKNYIIFNEEEAIKENKNSYSFRLLIYIDVINLDSKNFEKFVEDRKSSTGRKNLCDFLVLNNISPEQIIENCDQLPVKTVLIYPEDYISYIHKKNDIELDNPFLLEDDEKSWLARRFILRKGYQSADNESLWENFLEKLLQKNSFKKYSTIHVYGFIDNIESFNLNDNGDEEICIVHRGDENKCTSTNNIVSFSKGDPFASLWLKKLIDPGKIDQFQWNILLGSKILLVDDRIFDEYDDLDKIIQKELELLGVKVYPEKNTDIVEEDQKILIKNSEKNQEDTLSDFHFLSIHYGYLEKGGHALKNKRLMDRFPLFTFMHTGRGKIEDEFIENYYWFRKVFSVSNLRIPFSKHFALTIKILLLELNFLTA